MGERRKLACPFPLTEPRRLPRRPTSFRRVGGESRSAEVEEERKDEPCGGSGCRTKSRNSRGPRRAISGFGCCSIRRVSEASIGGNRRPKRPSYCCSDIGRCPTRAFSVAFKIRFSNVWIPSADQAVRRRLFINKDSYPVAGLDRIEAQGRACEHNLAGLESEPELGKMAPQPIQRGARPPRKRP